MTTATHMRSRLPAFVVAAVFVLLGGCAQSSKHIEPESIPSIKYRDFTCSQLAARLDDVDRRLTALIPIQDSAAKLDAVALPAGLISLWIPVLFMSGGAHKEELAILKGEVTAIEQSATEKPCNEITNYIQSRRVAGQAASERMGR